MNNREYFWAGFRAFSAQAVLGMLYIFLEPQITWSVWTDWTSAYPPIKLFGLIFVFFILSAPITRKFRLEMARRRDEKLRVSSHALDQFSLELVERLQSELHLTGVKGSCHWSLHIPKTSGISFDIEISRDSLEWGAIARNFEGSMWQQRKEYFATKGEWPEELQTKMASEVLSFANTLLASEVRGTTKRKVLQSKLSMEWKINNAWQATKIANA